jgi:DNA topoisomerase-1
VIDYDFTANVEEEFDQIAAGKLKRNAMLEEFYGPFHKLIEKSGDIDRASVAQARKVGIDPKSGKPILARFGKYGPMIQLGETESEEKPQFASLPKGTTIENVTLEQALEMFKLPRTVGKTESGEEIKANIGRFGPYIQVGKAYVSLKEDDPLTIDEAKARVLYAEKQQKDADKYINTWGKIQVINGPYGPYITDGKKNAKIPKEAKAENLTKEQAMELLAQAPAKKSFRRRKTKK